MNRRVRRARGSALIIVILVVLVLTVVGVGVAYFTQIEDRLSGNTRVMKTSFYAAEAGLKAGEKAIDDGYAASGTYSYLGRLVNTNRPSYAPPGGGNTAYLLVVDGVTFQDMRVDEDDAAKGSFTLYVRHGRSVDLTAIVNLISVGVDRDGGITRVLEEQLTIPGLSTAAAPTQTGGTPGGAGSVAAGG